MHFGIMQGRLTPSQGRGIQFFPFDNWEREFLLAQQLKLDEIEWIFDYDRFQDNPLWTSAGIDRIKAAISDTGVGVRSICFDYFMRRPFYKAEAGERKRVHEENLEFSKRILSSMPEIGAELLEIPMVDASSVKNAEERALAIDFLRELIDVARPAGIMIGCETDMPVGVFRTFLDEIGSGSVFANYDSGNSSGLGYEHDAEILSLAEYIANVHIKDRVLHGTTVALGTGSADFDKVFGALKKIGYDKSMLLQAARGEDGDECRNIRDQMRFVHGYCAKYGLE